MDGDEAHEEWLRYQAERRAIRSGRPLSQELAELRHPKPAPIKGGLFDFDSEQTLG